MLINGEGAHHHENLARFLGGGGTFFLSQSFALLTLITANYTVPRFDFRVHSSFINYFLIFVDVS